MCAKAKVQPEETAGAQALGQERPWLVERAGRQPVWPECREQRKRGAGSSWRGRRGRTFQNPRRLSEKLWFHMVLSECDIQIKGKHSDFFLICLIP